MGSGGAFLDADGDGKQDILLINGMNWPWTAGVEVDDGALPQQR